MEKGEELHSDSQDSELLNLDNEEEEDEELLPEADTSQLMEEK